MKFIKIIFLILLALLLVLSCGIFIFFQTFDTDQYLPQITKKATLAIGRPVSIGAVGLGISLRGITLDAGPVTIADDAGFTTQPFIKVDRIRISLDLRSLILHRKIHITHILLQSPQIHFIRDQEGIFNVHNIGLDYSHPEPPIKTFGGKLREGEGSHPSQDSSPIGPRMTASPINPLIKSITIQDAAISYIDQNQAFPVDIWLSNINASLNDVSLSKPIEISLDACLYSNTPNVHLSALVSLDPLKRSVQISNLSQRVDFSHLNMDQIKGISPQMPDSPLLKNIAGDLRLNLAHLDLDSSGGLTADGEIIITNGIIRGFNVIKTLLSNTLGAFGGMEDAIDHMLNGQVKDKLGAEDTVLRQAHAQFSIHDKTIFIDDSLIETNIFELSAKGSVDQGLNMDMQTILRLNEDVSAAMVNEIDGLKYLCDDSKRITIDASLKGVIPHLKYKPNKDFRKKSKKMFMEEGGSILSAFLGSR